MLEDIRERLNDSEHVYFCATEEETRHLISLIDHHNEAWGVMANIPMSMHPSEIRDFAKKMLKGQKPYALKE